MLGTLFYERPHSKLFPDFRLACSPLSMVNWMADQWLHSPLCGSLDVDYIARFPASDTRGVPLIGARATVVRMLYPVYYPFISSRK